MSGAGEHHQSRAFNLFFHFTAVAQRGGGIFVPPYQQRFRGYLRQQRLQILVAGLAQAAAHYRRRGGIVRRTEFLLKTV